MDIILYINGEQADIDTKTTIVLSKMFTDVTNPTAVKNTFSKTVTLPGTDHNNRLFEYIYKVDQIAINFDPAKRVDFVLYSGSALLSYGYMKLKSIDVNNDQPYQYKIELFGGLGDFFYTLSEKTLEEVNVNPANYDHTINRQAVINSWTSDYYCYMLSYSGKYDNFTSNKIDRAESFAQYLKVRTCYVDENGSNISVVAGGTNFAVINRYPNGTVVLDNILQGLNVDGYKVHIRSVAPRSAPPTNVTPGTPVVSVGAYWFAIDSSGNGNFLAYEIDYNLYDVIGNGSRFVAVGEGVIITSTTGRDGTWTVAYTNSSIKFIGVSYSKGYFCAITNRGAYAYSTNGTSWTFVNAGNNAYEFYCIIPNDLTSNHYSKYTFILSGTNKTSGTNIGLIMYLRIDTGKALFRDFSNCPIINSVATITNTSLAFCGTIPSKDGDDSGFVLHASVNNGNTVSTNKPMYSCNDNLTFGFIAVGEDNQIQYIPGHGNQFLKIDTVYEVRDIPDYDEIQINQFRSYYQRPALRFKHLFTQIINDSGFNVQLDQAFFNDENPYWEKTWISLDRLKANPSDLSVNDADNIRTGATVRYADMVPDGISQMDFILHYCKVFGLVFDVDDVTETITIKTRNTFFSDYTILDWTEKMDRSKMQEIKPLTFDFATGIFKWEANGTHYEDAYRDKYNIDYGAFELSTNYEFNSTEKDLISNKVFINGVISKEYDTNFRKATNYQDDKKLPAFFTKSDNERSYTSASMCLLFRGFDQEGNVQPGDPPQLRVFISDDNDNMREDKEYYWSYDNLTLVKTIPFFTRVLTNVGASLDFGKSEEAYYPELRDELYETQYTIYERFWRKYINDLYNPDARIMTAYFYLSPLDYNMFKFNSFVRLENTLWHVNSISDYNVTGDNSSKVELVRVTDIKNYTSGQNLSFSGVGGGPQVRSAKVRAPKSIKLKLNILTNVCEDTHNMTKDDGNNSDGSS